MIAVSTADATIWVAGIAALGTILTTTLALQNKRNLSTGNGHTAGQSLTRIEDQLRDHENRLDRIEVQTVEVLGDIRDAVNVAAADRTRIAHELELHYAIYKHEKRDHDL